jgi:hypothetical protein
MCRLVDQLHVALVDVDPARVGDPLAALSQIDFLSLAGWMFTM